jgi:8-oxo-dGTP pyrophosphatase MutT (NUDIX family)
MLDLSSDSFQVAHSVTIGVGKRTGVYLVEDRRLPPGLILFSSHERTVTGRPDEGMNATHRAMDTLVTGSVGQATAMTTDDPSNTLLRAATLVVARDRSDDAGIEVLMVQRSGHGAFANLWVFPGGRVDPLDTQRHAPAPSAPHKASLELTAEIESARNAAVREAREEVGIDVAPDSLVAWSHWTPPVTAPKRYATWFFVAQWRGDDIRIDDHEIVAAEWHTPAGALTAGLHLAPPTIVTLHELCEVETVERLWRSDPPRYLTRPTRTADGRDALLWFGDAGYESGDADAVGPRHRLWYQDAAVWQFERTIRVAGPRSSPTEQDP